jgi:hypothetical protein
LLIRYTKPSISPEILEPVRRQIRVACGVLNVPMPEVLLDRPSSLWQKCGFGFCEEI